MNFKNFKLIILSFKEIFKKPSYFLTVILGCLIFLMFIIWLQNYALLKYIFISNNINFFQKIRFLLDGINILKTSFSFFGSLNVVVLSFLSGINISMTIYHIHQKYKTDKFSNIGFLGMLVGILGVGCGACGSIILTSIFGVGVTGFFVKILPFAGSEIMFIANLILIWSVYIIAIKIQKSKTCLL